MKDLLVLWDPENPLVPVAPVVDALTRRSDVRVSTMTFRELGHPTLPNRAFDLRSLQGFAEPDGILWIEGGPLPDLTWFSGPKACWLVNTHLEPTLLDDIGPAFDQVFSALLRDCAEEKARWLPLSAREGDRLSPPSGLSLLVDDPRPPSHVQVEQTLLAAGTDLEGCSTPIVVCMGNGGRVHPLFLEALRSGMAVVADPESDLRGIALRGDHLESYPAGEGLAPYLKGLQQDTERLAHMAARGPAIVEHLHQPAMRAAEICHGLWPRHRVLSQVGHQPRISILVTCHRYLKRFKVCLESLARQRLPEGAIEIVVADPGSPDGLAAYLEECALKNPGLRVIHLPLEARYHRNRGVGINRAFDVSSGQVVIGIDGDLVFPPTLIEMLEARVLNMPQRVYGIRRSFIGREDTEQILSGKLDPFDRFEELSRSEGDGEENAFVGVLGYCQAVHRTAFAKARYPEEFDMVNQSDIVFVERLAREAQVHPQFLEDLTVLHLWHPRNWSGTQEFL